MITHDQHRPPSPTVVDVLVALRSSWLAVLFVVAAAAGAGQVIGARADARYEATAQLSIASDGALVGVFGQPVPGAAIGATEVELLAESTSVLARAVESIGAPIDAVEGVDASIGDERIRSTVTVKVTAATPGVAVDAVNALADAVVASHHERLKASLDAGIAALSRSVAERTARVADLNAQLVFATPDQLVALEAARAAAVDSERQLQRRADELEVEAAAARSPISVAVEAVTAERTGPARPLHVAILAGLLAAAISAAVVYVRIGFAMAASRGAVAGPAADHTVGVVSTDEAARRPWGRRDIS